MANIRIDLNHTPLNGETVSFRAPCNASDIAGLTIYYVDNGGATVSREFTLNDANGNDIGSIDSIFAEGAIVKVILDTDLNNAFVQNPDTNAYLEGKFKDIAGTYSYMTMTASNWAGNTYSFEAAYPKASYDISVEVAPTATAEQFEAFGGAMICGSADSNIATAIGDVPIVDIPLIIKVVAK